MKVRDSMKRMVKGMDGTACPYRLRRLYCSRCNELHIEYPDFIVKGKHYSREVIEAVRAGESSYFGGDEKTMRIWKKE